MQCYGLSMKYPSQGPVLVTCYPARCVLHGGHSILVLLLFPDPCAGVNTLVGFLVFCGENNIGNFFTVWSPSYSIVPPTQGGLSLLKLWLKYFLSEIIVVTGMRN